MLSRMSQRHLPHLAGAFAVLLAASLQTATAGLANPDIQIRGTADAMRVEATEASITEVLSALGPAFHIRYRSEIPLDREISGVYRGSLKRVIARLLKGYNYFAKRDGAAMEIVIISERQQPAASPYEQSQQQQRAQQLQRQRLRQQRIRQRMLQRRYQRP